MFAPSEIPVPEGTLWGFVALQYHTLILNRVYAVCVGAGSLVALVGRGAVISPPVARENMSTPLWWLRREKMATYANLELNEEAVTKAAFANLRIPIHAIESITFTTDAKWGMGNVPYSGRIIVVAAGRRREFILLGKENGAAVCERLQQWAALGNKAPERAREK